MAEDKSSGAKSAAKKEKKEKPPAPEEKPFQECIQQHFLPDLDKALQEQGLNDLELSFVEQPLKVFGSVDSDDYWHVKGTWQGGRQFNIAFIQEDITGPKVWYWADKGGQPSTIEQFMGDERKISVDLMVLYTIQRLNAQKWLTRN